MNWKGVSGCQYVKDVWSTNCSKESGCVPKTREKLLQILIQDKFVSTGILFAALAGNGWTGV